MNPEITKLVNEIIASQKVVIFSKSYCPYCNTAKKIFDDMNQPYKALELDEHTDGDQIQAVLGEITGAKTVPRVFVNGKCLGGCSDVKAMLNSGELQKCLD